MPIFYKDPRPVDPVRHGPLSLLPENDFGFARGTNAVPLNLTEFSVAARHFPIVFVRDPIPLALAVLGMRRDENVFVDDKGRWRSGCYIPAYVRRYPFIIFESEAGQKLSLCVDEASNALSQSDVRPFFKNGEPTETLRTALEFSAAFQRDHLVTRTYVKRLADNDLLTASQANASLKNGEQLAIGGFEVVDTKKFNALSDSDFLTLRRDGALAATYAHFIAQSSWDSLLNLSAGTPPH